MASSGGLPTAVVWKLALKAATVLHVNARQTHHMCSLWLLRRKCARKCVMGPDNGGERAKYISWPVVVMELAGMRRRWA